MLTAFDLSLRHLDAAVAVARSGSISGASLAVNLSQPALTQALAKLEQRVGHRLFHRHSKGVIPTRAGDIFLVRAERAVGWIAEGGRSFPRAPHLTPIAHLERIASIGQLRAIDAVERAGSYTLAARALGLSQPSVHRAVRELELVLGVPLFERAGRVMRATPDAKRLVGSVRRMASELQAGLDELSALRLAGEGRITIGALQLPRAGLLPDALSQFARRHPRATVVVVEGAYGELLNELRSGDIDIVVGALRSPVPTDDVRQTSLFEDELFIVGRSDHPLSGEPAPKAEDLRSFPWVVGAKGAPMRFIWEELFKAAETPEVQVECSSILTARGLLLGGHWLALMSPDQFRIEREAKLLASIGGPVPGSRRKIGVTVRADWRPTQTQKALLEELRAAGARRSAAPA